MPSFTTSTLTIQGTLAVTAALAGTQLVMTRVAVGSGIATGNLTNLIGLVTPQLNCTPAPPQVSANQVAPDEVVVIATLDSQNVGATFNLTEIGVFATSGGGAEILLAYIQCQTPGDLIQHQTGSSRLQINSKIPIVVGVGSSTQVTVVAGNPLFIPPVVAGAGITVQSPVDGSGNVLQWIVSSTVAAVPTGAILNFAGAVAPNGYYICDGSAKSRSTDINLFTVIGTTYGAGDGVSTFNLPDFRGRVAVGAGQGVGLTSRLIGQSFGEEVHLLSIAEMPSHSHGISDPTHAHGVADPTHAHGVADPTHVHYSESLYWTNVQLQGYWPYADTLAPNRFWYRALAGTGNPGFGGGGSPSTTASITSIGIYGAATGIGIFGAATGIGILATGSNNTHNNMQPTLVVNKIIKN